jgi:long-chain acyl-CoA synthetase
METLADLIHEIERLDEREALRFYNGYRTWTLSYRSLYRRIAGVVEFLDRQGLGKGDRVLLWGENRPEWITVFWAAVARGVEIVPVDFRASSRLVRRIQERVGARWLVHGSQVAAMPSESKLETISFQRIAQWEADRFEIATVFRDDVVQIIFTSGTTGDPKGVVHRHRHLCANLTPFQREIAKYKKLAFPFQPIRILNLLPLSHLFGQSLGLFIPVLLEGASVFTTRVHADAVIRTARREHVSVLVGVPQVLKNLRSEVERKTPIVAAAPGGATAGLAGALRAWWTYRDVHRAFGWKFWALVVGGARLAPDEEAFWRRLGLVVVQGYGLTETSPAVTANHPFHPRPGSLGRIVGDLEIRIAPDGEILVRGESVVSEYLGGAPTSGIFVDAEGWLHTGDVGRLDEERNLYFLGRKKDLIVTADGLNVYPQDVEAALNQLPEIRDSVVLGVTRDEKEEVHAVLLLNNPEADVERLIGHVNETLEPYQRIRGWTVWTDQDFPRTTSTMKVQRQEVLARLRGTTPVSKPASEASVGVAGVLAEMTGRGVSELRGDLRISEDLGLSSLEQVDLLSRLEERYGIPLDETSIAEDETIGALEDRLRAPPTRGPETEVVSVAREVRLDGRSRWSRSFPVRWARTAIQEAVFWPLLHHYIDLTVEGAENLNTVAPPVLFAANHESHLDTPFIIAALPYRWRRWIAPAAQEAHFRAYLHPSRSNFADWAGAGLQYGLACALFNIYTLPRNVPAVRRALRFTGDLVEKGYCPLVFPEGQRSPDGEMMPFELGIGMMAVRLGVPVIPLHLRGMYQIFSLHDRWPRRGEVRVRIGKPLLFEEQDDYGAATGRIRQSILDLRVSGTRS